MHVILTVFAVIFVLAGFAGFFFGVIPTIVFWVLAALCIIGAWGSRPARLRRREDRLSGHPTA